MQPVADLISAASNGDNNAWDALVERYGRLVWSVVRSFRLDDAAAADVSQTTWLRLVENLHKIREPERLPSWLATTAKREAMRVSKAQRRQVPTEFEYDVEDATAAPVDEALLDAEDHETLLAAFEQLDGACAQLLRLMTVDPPLDYETIAELMGRPVGSIGPTRGRCLERLRRAMGGAGG